METPVTNLVRDHEGDYIEAVEDLENSHAALLAAAKGAQECLHEFHPQQHHIPVGKGICEWEPCRRLREAIAAVERDKAQEEK